MLHLVTWSSPTWETAATFRLIRMMIHRRWKSWGQMGAASCRATSA